ncbi:Zn-ribbon domain-containing OB-fold protein [Planctomycetota bacterium]
MSEASSWRSYAQRYRMEAAKNKKSGNIYFPPRLICPDSKTTEFEPVTLAEEGVVETYTVIPNPTSEFTAEAPITIAIIKLDDGVRINAPIADVDPGEVKTGDRVRREFRKIYSEGEAGIIHYGYKFVVVDK